jgi:hypothetical protein
LVGWSSRWWRCCTSPCAATTRSFIVKPIRETRTVPLDGLLVACFTLIVWQDPGCNYVKPWGTYNTHLIQWGSWVEHLPWWMSPNGSRFAEPLLVMVGVPQLMPRWVAYLSFFVTLSFLEILLQLLLFFRSGPFAWHGVVTYYVILIGFFGWMAAVSLYVLKALRRLEHEETIAAGDG